MSKYLELFEDGFDATITEKIKPENWPYVSYSPSEGVVFTVIPEPVVGPADNEIWYTSNNKNVVTPYNSTVFGASVTSNTYEDNKGIIKFNNSVSSIGGWAFYNCKSITSIAVPNSATSIGDYAFASCTSLDSVTINNSVTYIGNRAFYYCDSLTVITFDGTMEEWNKVNKGSNWNNRVPATYVQCSDGQVEL